MCCLFGVYDYTGGLTAAQKRRLVSALATASEARGTDATGVAYNSDGHLAVYKRPWPAHLMRFRLPENVRCVMGHTRMTTQGDEKKNCNNHPFVGTSGMPFALAHNGIIYNDKELRQELDQINRQLKEAYERFNYACEPELVEASIFEINALKAKYDYLLRCVKERSGMPVNRRAAVPAAQEACVAASAVKGGKPCRS